MYVMYFNFSFGLQFIIILILFYFYSRRNRLTDKQRFIKAKAMINKTQYMDNSIFRLYIRCRDIGIGQIVIEKIVYIRVEQLPVTGIFNSIGIMIHQTNIHGSSIE